MRFARFLVRRLLQAIPVLIGVTLVVFLMIHLVPGDPARTALGQHVSPEALARLQDQWGLNQSLPAQYMEFLERLVTGDLGISLRYGQPAGPLIVERLPVTIWLLVYSAVLTCLIGIPLALLAASRPGAIRDKLVRVLSVAGLGIPSFWLGLILIEYLAVEAQLLPPAGYGDGFLGHIESMFLPSLTIAAAVVPLVVRSLRAEVLRVNASEYVTTARAKGLSEGQIRMRHVLRNAAAPAVTVLAVNMSFLVGGTMVVERIFSLPGVGNLMLQGIIARDFGIVQAVTFVLALIVILVSIFGDLVQALIDPRVEAR